MGRRLPIEISIACTSWLFARSRLGYHLMKGLDLLTNVIGVGLLLQGGMILAKEGWETDVHVLRSVSSSNKNGSWIIKMWVVLTPRSSSECMVFVENLTKNSCTPPRADSHNSTNPRPNQSYLCVLTLPAPRLSIALYRQEVSHLPIDL